MRAAGAKGSNIHFPLSANGMDYLISVVDHLDGDPSPRDLKYAVLHLQAATEVLLKACLIIFDWRLVFTKPDEADERLYKRGDFNSCDMSQTIKRLRDQGVSIPPEIKAAITRLANHRNRLQHFGLTSTAIAIEAAAAEVLDFLLTFIHEQLQPDLQGTEEAHVADGMELVRGRLHQIRTLVTTRMKRLRPELQPYAAQTLKCPNCGQWAMIADAGEAQCRFCQTEWDPNTLPLAYMVDVLGNSWRAFRKGEPPADVCPECWGETLVHGAFLADAPETPRSFCFGCSHAFDGLANCIRCGLPFQIGADGWPICRTCRDEMTARD
ncbi:hypothetical protein [Nonomuraea sp. NEAU-A123]|uniref:hypothetical protein n=1 Tax=Nonomuraea sp. NEAU-A123 TaxID=2839649 RepID=UPI001BE4611E|nr:hypothetical protein [Nonomuraea sp. NEAU-A123]MBT2234409.1 hypothetical protein [Nonomuraea sp. NEAU-A123]